MTTIPKPLCLRFGGNAPWQTLLAAHPGKLSGAVLGLVLLLVGQVYPLGDWLRTAEQTWNASSRQALSPLPPRRLPPGTALVGARQVWEQLRTMIDLSLRLTEGTADEVPGTPPPAAAAGSSQERQAEALRQWMESGAVDEKEWREGIAPAFPGGWRPAAPAATPR